MNTLLVVGSINMDLVAQVHHHPAPGETVTAQDFSAIPGGKGANQAVAAARLGGSVAMVGRLGDDASAATLREGLRADGVDVTAVTSVPGPSGSAMITVKASGSNSIVVVPGANALLRPEDLLAHLALLRQAAMVLTQLEIPMDTVERLASLCLEAGTPLMLDPAPAQPISAALLQKTAWLTPNESETEALLHREETPLSQPFDPAEAATRLLALGVRNVAIKLGSRGVFLQGADVPAAHVPAPTVTPVDTTAAGDCFNAAFAVALAEGKDPAEAARFACAAAALSTTGHGAQPSLPTRRQVQQLLSAKGSTADPA